MIPKTGQWSNIILGVGDPTRFRLLGGSNGEAGDTVLFGSGAGTRFFRSSKAKILQAAGYGARVLDPWSGSVGDHGGSLPRDRLK